MSTQLTTYREASTLYMEGIRNLVCRELGISKDSYDLMHYDLAYAWFEHHGYLEYTARVFLVSKLFHRWWNLQVVLKEHQFMFKYGGKGLPIKLMNAAIEESIIEMDVIPSRELLRQMNNEGLAALKQYPELMKIKIYRHEWNGKV